MEQGDFAVIFDMDGVLVNNTSYHIMAWKSFCETHKLVWNEGIYLSKINGCPIRESISLLFPYPLDNEEIEKYGREKDEIFRDIYRKDIVPSPGLISFLKSLSENNIPMAIATSATSLNVAFTLENTGLAPYFNTILDESCITRGKPDPEIYLKAAAALGKSPVECIVFEDSISGIQSAKRAGTKVVAIASTHSSDKLSGVDLVYENFEGITINVLQSLFI